MVCGSAATTEMFSTVQERLLAAFDAYCRTPHGRRRLDNLRNERPITYQQFLATSPIGRENLSANGLLDLLVPGRLEEFSTTGTHGHPQSIYWPADTVADVKSLVSQIPSSSRVSAIYGAASIDRDIFLQVHVRGIKKELPHVSISGFSSPADVAGIISSSDAIILTDYPSSLARFLRLAKEAIGCGYVDSSTTYGKHLIVRLTGEPMFVNQLSYWHGEATRIGMSVRIELRYGCTEFLGIGRSDFSATAPRVEYRLTNQECFAEVLNPHTLRPLYVGRGIVCATSFRTSGTILYRYILGDEAEVFERDGERYLRDIRRADALIVTGNTVSLSDLVSSCRAATGLELCIAVRKAIDLHTGVQTVDVRVYVPYSANPRLAEAQIEVESRLLGSLKIGPAVAAGAVRLRVIASQMPAGGDRRRKAWRLVFAEDLGR